MKNILPVLFFLTIFFSCKSKEKVSEISSPANDTTLLASVERTPCFGRCATYKTTIYQSGYVVYHGKMNVKNIGYFSTRLDKEKVDQLKKYILENKILELDDRYVNPHIADYPTTITEAGLDGKYRHITETDPEAPEIVKNFPKYLDSFFNDDTRWMLLSNPSEEKK